MKDKSQQTCLEEVEEEWRAADPVVQSRKYRRFVSRSKGWRNGRRRIRKRWKEIHLVKYRGGRYSQWHRFPFDVYATEILGQHADGETLKMHIERLWGY
jgi:hypothetical protein